MEEHYLISKTDLDELKDRQINIQLGLEDTLNWLLEIQKENKDLYSIFSQQLKMLNEIKKDLEKLK